MAWSTFFGAGLTENCSGLWDDPSDFGLLRATTLLATFWTKVMPKRTTGCYFLGDFAPDLSKGTIAAASGKVTFFKGTVGPEKGVVPNRMRPRRRPDLSGPVPRCLSFPEKRRDPLGGLIALPAGRKGGNGPLDRRRIDA